MQMGFSLNSHGGRRKGSGRPSTRSPGVSHDTRKKVTARTPLHINFKYRIPVRNKDTLKLLKRSLANARRHGLLILNFSFQHNHVHLIVQAPTNEILTRGMRSLTITFAKGLKKGRVQVERYHLHILKTIAEARNAIRYVIFNQQKHESGTYSVVNSYSSLLSLPEWQVLIRKFVKLKKMSLKIEKGEIWKTDMTSQYIYTRAYRSLYQDQTSFT